ncbi:MAG: glucose-6-phosphate dehydrogenase [Candidatus Woesearchaeota archaeon]|nr:glucose-6-phosphate dehydrogenase [Candidatus Woesearchaeota archaeon]
MQPTTIILFGGTGDLTKRKLLPAFATLLREEKLARGSLLIGIGRRPLTHEAYRHSLVTDLSSPDQALLKDLQIFYFQDDVGQTSGLQTLPAFLQEHESQSSNRIYYLATSYTLFPNIVQALHRTHLDKHTGGWTRLVFEKPFGHDLASSDALDKAIHAVFSEDNIFRIDHYLAKETVQNLQVVKFTNPVIDTLFHRALVSHITLTVDESLGVGNRLGYYAEAGVLKDMIQNHLLQMTALLLMEQPKTLTNGALHTAKVEVLTHLHVAPAEQHLLGQYQSYKEECIQAKIAYTNTATFAKLVLTCSLPRWKDIPIILRTGKKLPKKYGQLIVHFKPLSASPYPEQRLAENQLIIDVYPEQDIRLRMNTRKPGTNILAPVNLLFSPKAHFGPNTSDEYATLLGDVLRGEKMLFTRSDEVQAAWKIVEQIEALKNKIPFVIYPDGTDPEQKS